MGNRRTSVAAAAALLLAGCSATAAPERSADALTPGSAMIEIDSGDTSLENTVSCQPLGGALSSIVIGDEVSGIDVSLDTADGVSATSVSITNVDGFTGSYWRDLQGEATASMTGKVVTINGTARGFATDQPSFVTEKPFRIRVAC